MGGDVYGNLGWIVVPILFIFLIPGIVIGIITGNFAMGGIVFMADFGTVILVALAIDIIG